MSEDPNKKSSVFEEHKLLSTLLGMAGGIILTYVTAVMSHERSITRIEIQIENLRETIEMNMSDRYRGADAERDFRLRDHQISEMAGRIERLENQYRSAGPRS